MKSCTVLQSSTTGSQQPASSSRVGSPWQRVQSFLAFWTAHGVLMFRSP